VKKVNGKSKRIYIR